MSKCFVECREQGTTLNWKPIAAFFGVGRYEVDDAAQAEAEIRLWQRTLKSRGLEFRIRKAPEPPQPKTEEKRQAEIAKQAEVSKSIAKSVSAAKKSLAQR